VLRFRDSRRFAFRRAWLRQHSGGTLFNGKAFQPSGREVRCGFPIWKVAAESPQSRGAYAEALAGIGKALESHEELETR